eukprot:gene4445-8858_t
MDNIGWLVEWSDKVNNKYRCIVYDLDEKGNYLTFLEDTLKQIVVPSKTRIFKVRPAQKELTKFRLNDGLERWNGEADLNTSALLIGFNENLSKKGIDPLLKMSKIVAKNLVIKPRKPSNKTPDIVEEEDIPHDSDDDDDGDEDDDEDEDTVRIKVYITSTQEHRGFCLPKAIALTKLNKHLENHYGSQPKLYYRDPEGDVVLIAGKSDFKYALKMHEKLNETSKNETTLRLMAEFPSISIKNTKNTFSSEKDKQLLKLSLSKQITNEVDDIQDDVVTAHGSLATNFSKKLQLQQQLQQNNIDVEVEVDEEDSIAEELLWQKGDKLGAGSYGQVYCGINLITGEMMAIKEVRLGNENTAKEQAYALQMEIKILSNLDHPNIIKYLGAEYSADTLRIFLELATEGSIKDVLKKFGPLSEPILRRYTSQILSGLTFLHQRGIIHRDIKPSNILLDKNGVKLADFGCSCTANLTDDGTKSVDAHGTVVGTTVYMSPEVMKGDSAEIDGIDNNKADLNKSTDVMDKKGYGRKADVWSLGITICEMARGTAPFRSGAAAIYAVLVTKELPTLPDHMSEEAHSFLSRCLVVSPGERASCKDLQEHPFIAAQITNQSSRSIQSIVRSGTATGNGNGTGIRFVRTGNVSNEIELFNQYIAGGGASVSVFVSEEVSEEDIPPSVFSRKSKSTAHETVAAVVDEEANIPRVNSSSLSMSIARQQRVPSTNNHDIDDEWEESGSAFDSTLVSGDTWYNRSTKGTSDEMGTLLELRLSDQISLKKSDKKAGYSAFLADRWCECLTSSVHKISHAC